MIAQSFSHQPDWLEIAVECPNSFLAENLFERAAEERHKQGGPREIICLNKFAQFCEQQGKDDKAEQLLRQALVLTASVPQTKLIEWLCPNPFEFLGRFLERHGRGDEALALYLQSYNRADVARGELYYADRLPIMYYVRHHMADAEEGFRVQMLKECKAPAFSKPRQRQITELAELAIERNRPAQARKWLSQLKDPDWYDFTLWAWCHEQAGQVSEADADYRKAMQLMQKNPENLARLQYISFPKRHGRNTETKAHEEFCALVQKSHPGDLCSTASRPMLFGRQECLRESQLPEWDLPWENEAPARNADLLNGMQFLYGKVVDEEFGLKRSLGEAKTYGVRAWRMGDLCQCQARKKETEAALATLNQLFDLAAAEKVHQCPELVLAREPVLNLLLEDKKVSEALKLTQRQGAFYDKSLGSDNCMKGKEMGFDAEVYFAHKFYPQSIQLSNEALAFYEDQKATKRECSSKFVREIILKCLAVSNERLGHLQEAQGYYDRLVRESKKLGNGSNVLEELQEYAKVCQDLGDARKAAELRKEAEEWRAKASHC
jgi:tetratricopeptide (TPR) repeat protein